MSEQTKNITDRKTPASTLLDEVQAFERMLPELMKHAGKFALIQGGVLAGVYSAYEDALKIGYEKYGVTPFLVRKIAQTQNIAFISRSFAPCPA